MRVLCYTFTGKKLPDFIPYFFEDTMNYDTTFYERVDYVKINTNYDIENDIKNKQTNDYFNEIYVILEDKIRLNSFTRPLNEYTYCSFEDLCILLSMTSLNNLNANELIDYHTEKGVEFKV